MKPPSELLGVLIGIVLSCVAASASRAQDAPTNELVQMVVDLLHDADKEMRSVALDQVRADCKGQEATERFAAELPKLSPEGQTGLLTALGERGDPTARTAILKMLDESAVQSVRVAAIGALGHLGQTDDTRRLVQILAEGSEAEKTAARASLVRLQGDDFYASIAAEMDKAASPLRVGLIEILTTRRAMEMVPAILAAAVDDDPTVRVAAMKSLAKLASPEHLSGLLHGVLKADPGRERDAAEKCVAQVCSRIEEQDKRAAPLLAAIGQLDESNRQALLPTVGRVGGSDALKAVEAAIVADDPQLHEMGIRALCNWPDASIARRLIELAKTDDHPAHRTTALRAAIRVAALSDERSDVERLELLSETMEMCMRDVDRKLVLDRVRTVRTLEALRFLVPYVDRPDYAEQACLSVVELAHHRGLREPNKAEFDEALDEVIETSRDATTLDRAQRYKLDQTWVRPDKPITPVAIAQPKANGQVESTPSIRSDDAALSQSILPKSQPTDTKERAPAIQLRLLIIATCIGIVALVIIVVIFRNSRPDHG